MITFFKCISEELHYIFNKLGLMILFFLGMPVLATWLIGAYYHEYVNDIPIVVLDQDNSSLSRQIIQYFDEDERFKIMERVNTPEEMKKLIDEKEVYMGLYVPPNLSNKIKEGKPSQVMIFVDQTNVIIGNNAYAGAAQIVQNVSAGVGIQLVGEKESMLKETAYHEVIPMQTAERILFDPKMTYMNYLAYGLFAILIQSLMLSSLATLILRNPQQVGQDKTFIRLLAKIAVATTLILIMGSISLFFIHKKFGLIYNSNIRIALLMAILFAGAISVPAIILISLVKKKTRYTQIVYCLSLPTFLTCGYVWPVEQMPDFLVKIVRGVWPLINFARPFDEVMIKHLPFSAVKENIVGLILYIVIGMPIAVWCFKKGFAKESLDKENHQIINQTLSPSNNINV